MWSKTIFYWLPMCLIFTALGNEVAEYGGEEKLRQSEYVVLGKVISISEYTMSGEDAESIAYANVEVLGSVKGEVRGSLKFVYGVGISEWDSDCCEVGGLYLIFMSGKVNDFFYPANGPYSVYRVEGRQEMSK
ncbi:hypothetical protein D3C76_1414040 [compost metagenome]